MNINCVCLFLETMVWVRLHLGDTDFSTAVIVALGLRCAAVCFARTLFCVLRRLYSIQQLARVTVHSWCKCCYQRFYTISVKWTCCHDFVLSCLPPAFVIHTVTVTTILGMMIL